jgi:hypothetical protein
MKVLDKLQYDIDRLEETHALLEDKIATGFTYYLDDAHLNKMKQEKISVKRQLEETKSKLKAL